MRRTNASRLFKAITDNLVSVTSAVVNHDEGIKEPISNLRKIWSSMSIRAYLPIRLIFRMRKLQKISCSFPSEKQVVTAMTI